MKNADEVGRDFDEYARVWKEQNYGLEVGWAGGGVERDEGSTEVQHPGDEWGSASVLRTIYAGIVRHYGLTAPVDVLEIGAGGGRSTAALLEVLGPAAGAYHVIDVADAFVDTLRARIERPLDIHIVSDIDTSFLAPESIDLCLAQSSWSHINFYDQYRYLRDLRSALRPGAPVVVIGLFMLGSGDDWTWNRFRRRAHQIDQRIEGVFHEFTSVAMVAEMLNRLGYTDITMFSNGFAARRGSMTGDASKGKLPTVRYRWVTSLTAWFDGEPGRTGVLPVPPVPPQGMARVRASVKRRTKKLRHRLTP